MDDELAVLWARVKQAPDHAQRRQLLCGPLAGIVRALDVTSLEYKSVFGEENELLGVVCRTIVQDCRAATSRGYPLDLFAAFELLNSLEHITLLALLGNLVAAGDSSSLRKGYIEASARVLSLHNVPQHLCLLHEAYIEVLEHGRAANDDDTRGMSSWAVTPGATNFPGSDIVPNLDRVVVSPEVVATAQRQLSTLATILRSASEAGAAGALQLLLDDLFVKDRLLCLLRTFPSHMHFPHSSASSVSSLTHDVVAFVLSVSPGRLPGRIIARAVDALVGAFRFNFDDHANASDSAARVPEALQAQRLMVFDSLLSTLRCFLTVIPAPSNSKISDSFDEMTDFTGAINPSALEYNAIANGMLMLEGALQQHPRLGDRIFENLLGLASIAPVSTEGTLPKQPETKPRSYSIARFLSKALTAPTGKSDVKPAANIFNGVTVHVPEVIEAASSFVVCSSNATVRQNMGNRVLALIGDTSGVRMPASTRVSVLVKFVENLRNFEAALQVSIVSAFSSLVRGSECPMNDHMPSLISALHARSISYECASAILSLLTGIAGNHGITQPGLRSLLLEQGSVSVVLSLLDFLATQGSEASRFILTSAARASGECHDGHESPTQTRLSSVVRWNETLLALIAEFWRELIGIPIATDSGGSTSHPVFTERRTIDQLVRCVARRNSAGATARDMLVAVCRVSASAVGAGVAAAVASVAPGEDDVDELDLDDAAVTADSFWDVGLAAYEVFLASVESERQFVAQGGLAALMRVLGLFATFSVDLLRSWHPRTVLLTSLLSLSLRHVRFAKDAETHLFEALVSAPADYLPAIQLLLDLATGALIAPAAAAGTRQWIAAAARAGATADSEPDTPAETHELRMSCSMMGPLYVPEDPSQAHQWAPLEVAMDVLCDRLFGTDEHPADVPADVLEHARPAVVHAAAGMRSVGSLSFRQAVLRRQLPASAISNVAALPHATFRNLLREDADCGASLSIISSLLQAERTPPDITFVESGCALCDGATAGPFPQPARGVSMVGWVKWEMHVASSPRRSRRDGPEVPLWGVTFGRPDSAVTVELVVDVVADEAVIRARSVKGVEARQAVSMIDPASWHHVGFAIELPSAEKGAPQPHLTFFLNGDVAHHAAAPALANVLASAEPTSSVKVRLGFPLDANGEGHVGRTVSVGPAAVFSTAVGHGTVARMFAADRGQPLPLGFRPRATQLKTKPHLTAREQRLVRTCVGTAQAASFTLTNVQESDPIEDIDIAAVFHPADPLQVPCNGPLVDEWGNTGVGVPNLTSTTSAFVLHAPHFTPRPCYSVGHQLAGSGGHSVLLGWLDGAVGKDEPEVAAAVLRCLGAIAETAEFNRLTDASAWFAAVKLLFGAGRIISEAVVLREFISVAFPKPLGSAPVNRRDPAASLVADWPIVASITLAEHALLRWELLSYLPTSAALLTLDAISTVVAAENPFRAFNADRLYLANIVTHFTFGMSRACVDAAALLRAGRVIEDLLMALPKPGAAAAELLAFTASSVPVNGKTDECAQRLVTALPIEPCVSAVRNTILQACVRAVRRRGDELASAFAASCPTWWISTLVDTHAGPVSVGLALQLFSFMLADANFSKRARKGAAVGLLMKQCLPYSHQTDVLNGLALASLGVPCFPSATGAEPVSSVSPSCDVAYLPALLRCVRALTSTLASADVPDSMVCAPTTIRSYFSELGAVAHYKPSRLRSAAMAVFAVACFKSVRRGRGGTVAADSPLNPPAAPPLPEEQDRRLALVKHVLHFVSSLTPNNTVLECFTAAAHPSAMSEVAWLLFCLVPPAPAQAESLMLRQATQEECALVVVESSSDDDAASPNRDDAAPVQQQSTSIWSVDEVDNVPGRHANTLVADTADFIDTLCVAVAASSSAPVPVAGSTAVKLPPVVTLLHQLLNACPQDTPLFARHWYQAKLLTTFFAALRRAVVQIPGTPSNYTQINLLRSAAAIGIYAVERLAAGLPASAGDVIAFVNAVHFELGKHTATAEVMPLRQKLVHASVDWALFALSPGHHGWSRRLMVKACEAIVHFSSLIFAQPLSNDGLKSLLPRLAEVSLGVVVDYDASTTPPGRAVGEIWYKLFHTCRDSPVLTNGLIDTSSSPRVDLLHGGFDILYRQYDPITTFIGWFADCRFQVTAFFRKCYGNSATKYIDCVPQRHARTAAKAEQLWQLGSMQAEMRASETLSTCASAFERALESATLVEQSLISLRTSTAAVMSGFIREPPVLEPLAPPTETTGDGDVPRQQGFATYDPASGQLFLATTSDCGGPAGTLVAALLPIFGSGLTMGIVDPASGTVPLPEGSRELLHCAGSKQWLNPASQLLLTRLLGPNVGLVHWIGNVYVVAGGDSHIAVVVLTQTDLFFITMAQYVAASKDLVIAQPQEHDAASKRQTTRAVVTNMLRRFLPSSATVANRVLSAESEGGFRFSQYYRQIKAEATRSGRCDGTPRVWNIGLHWITAAANRSFQHQRAALELTLESREAWFFVVLDDEMTMRKVERDRFAETLTSVAPWVTVETTASMRNRVTGAQRLWMRRQLSTLSYLSMVNSAGSRTPCDLSQYPVLPWTLPCAADDPGDATEPKQVRDLSKPIGATNPQRAEEIAMRYAEWLDDETPPFHHGTHYSSSAVVMYFLVRLNPFAAQSARYQGGRLDVADRLFHSVPEAWASSTGARGGDTKELIPEMYTLPELNANINRVALGTRRDGVDLDAVQLPKWAPSAQKFCVLQRAALESEAVGAGLHGWIDLVFGSKQQGDEAVAACNVFHHVSYERGLQRAMEAATSEESRKAIVAQVENFGLTPRTAFKGPHPRRAPSTAGSHATSKQAQFIHALPTLTERPERNTLRHLRATGGPQSLREVDSTIVCCMQRVCFGGARPLQAFELRGRYDVTVRSRDDELVSSVPSIAGYGEGDAVAVACSTSGNVLCVASSRAVVFVYVRNGPQSRFDLVHVLRHSARTSGRRRRVTLRLFSNNTLAAIIDDRFVAVWRVTVHSSAFCYLSDMAAPIPEDETVRVDESGHGRVVGVCMDGRDGGRSGFVYVCHEWGIMMLSRRGRVVASNNLRSAAVAVSASPGKGRPDAAPQGSTVSSLSDSVTSTGLQHLNGTQRLRVMSALQEPMTCACHIPWPTYSPQELVVVGHADGSLSFWIVQAVTTAADSAAFRLVFHTMQPRADGMRPSPATAIMPRQERGFAVAFEDGSVSSFAVSAIDSEPL